MDQIPAIPGSASASWQQTASGMGSAAQANKARRVQPLRNHGFFEEQRTSSRSSKAPTAAEGKGNR